MQQRLYFPLFKATQILGGAAYLKEIKKLRGLGAFVFVPRIKPISIRKYPLKITFTFFAFDDCDMTTMSIIAAYFLHLMESHTTIQCADARVIPEVSIKTKRVITRDNEGCEISVELATD